MPDVRRWLAEGARVYDDVGNGLAPAAREARRGFTGGAEWMRRALGVLRGGEPPTGTAEFALLGLYKYSLALLAVLLTIGLARALASPWPLLLVPPVFYAVEAQAVFLFPVALDGAALPVQEARRTTVLAGGTLAVMAGVVPVAASMLFGGFAGRGFLRSWCVGCLAVLVWYEEVRLGAAPEVSA